jgi:anti-anti-sigma factor
MPRGEVHVDTDTRPEGPVVCLVGDIDYPMEREVLEAFITAQQCATDTVFLDASGVTSMESTGLRALLIANRNLGLEHKGLRIIAASESVARLIEITGLEQILPIEGP